MQGWANDLGAFHAGIWAELGDFTRERAGYAGLASLATIGPRGPEVRNIVVRGADRAVARLVMHTDRDSQKVAELQRDPAASLLVWNPDHQLQIRARGRVEVLGPWAADEIWATLPFASKGNYGVAPVPGTPIAHAQDYERVPDRARLAVIALHVDEIDAVQLAEPHHIRARFRELDDWAGQWLAP